MAKPSSKATRLAELAGAPPKLATAEDLQAAGPRTGRTHAVQTSGANKASRGLTMNLKAVSEALVEEGMDPAVEFARVLKGRPLLDDNGNQVIDPQTGQPARAYDIDADVRVRMLSEILQYTQPKLKAVEVKLNGALELSSEQLDQRLSALLAKAAK
jgi:hypothetical protein